MTDSPPPGSPLSTRLAKVRALAADRKQRVEAESKAKREADRQLRQQQSPVHSPSQLASPEPEPQTTERVSQLAIELAECQRRARAEVGELEARNDKAARENLRLEQALKAQQECEQPIGPAELEERVKQLEAVNAGLEHKLAAAADADQLADLRKRIKELERAKRKDQALLEQASVARNELVGQLEDARRSVQELGSDQAKREKVSLLYREAIEAESRSEFEQCRELLERVVETDGEHKSAHRKLGMLLSDQFGQHQQAEQHFVQVERIQKNQRSQQAGRAGQAWGLKQIAALQAEAVRAGELDWELQQSQQRNRELQQMMDQLKFELSEIKRLERETMEAEKYSRQAMEAEQEARELRQSLGSMEQLQREHARATKERAQFQAQAGQANREVVALAEQVMASDLELERALAQLTGVETAFNKLKKQAAARGVLHCQQRSLETVLKLILNRWQARKAHTG